MKRLDKPTKRGMDNLLNIEKKSLIPFNFPSIGRLSEYLTAITAHYCSHVSGTLSLESFSSYIQLGAVVDSAAKDEGHSGRIKRK